MPICYRVCIYLIYLLIHNNLTNIHGFQDYFISKYFCKVMYWFLKTNIPN